MANRREEDGGALKLGDALLQGQDIASNLDSLLKAGPALAAFCVSVGAGAPNMPPDARGPIAGLLVGAALLVRLFRKKGDPGEPQLPAGLEDRFNELAALIEDNRGALDRARVKAKIDALFEFKASKAQVEGVWRELEALADRHEAQIAAINARLPKGAPVEETHVALALQLKDIQTGIERLETDERQRHAGVMAQLGVVTDLLTKALTDMDHRQQVVDDLQRQIKDLIAERERMLAAGAVSEDDPFHSVFISRAEPDAEFAERLVADLRHDNVSCWHYTQDMKGGEDWQAQISKAIKIHDKLLLVCSRSSVYRPNVVKEIYQAIDEERRTGAQKLFPIRLDNHILSPEMEQAGLDAARLMNRLDNWVAIVKKKHIPDFSDWRNHDAYKAEFARLLRDLKR